MDVLLKGSRFLSLKVNAFVEDSESASMASRKGEVNLSRLSTLGGVYVHAKIGFGS